MDETEKTARKCPFLAQMETMKKFAPVVDTDIISERSETAPTDIADGKRRQTCEMNLKPPSTDYINSEKGKGLLLCNWLYAYRCLDT